MVVKKRRSNFDDDGPTREITINGVTFFVSTPQQIRALGIEDDTFWNVGSKRLYVQGKNWRDLYKAAGYDTNQIDFAYPEQWRDNNADVDRRFKRGDYAAWYYGGRNKIFGEPVWHSEVQHKIIAIAKRKLGM